MSKAAVTEVTETAAVSTDAAVNKLIANASGERRMVPLKNLLHSEKNVRGQQGYSAESVEEIAALILSQGGVLHNLVGYDEKKKGKLTGKVPVAAGGRRLAGLNFLRENGQIDGEFLVPVLIVDESVATEVSLIENTHREEMHPAQEFMAFRKLIEEDKKTPEEVAVIFGVTPLTVERRMRLAMLHPMFIELYLNGKVQMDQLQALTLTADQEKQVAVWKSLPQYNRSAYYIKEAITTGEVDIKDDRIARYVGVDAYLKAGGTIRPDMFSEGSGYVENYELILQLAREKMEKTAAKLTKAGAAFVEMDFEQDWAYELRRRFVAVPLTRREPTKQEQKKIASLEAKIKDIEETESKLADDPDATEDAIEAVQNRHEDYESELCDLYAKLNCPDPDYADKTGAVLFINSSGKLEKLENVVRAEDIKRAKIIASGGNPDDVLKQGRPAMSERLVRLLTAHRTAAIQASMMQQPKVALAAMVADLLFLHFHHYGEKHVHVNVTHAGLSGADPEKTLQQSRAGQILNEHEDRWRTVYEGIPEDGFFEWALEQPLETLLEALAFLIAPGFSSIEGRAEDGNTAAAYQRALGVNMADWWQPSADLYLKLIPKKQILETVTEAKSAEAAASIANHKKDALIGAAADQLDGSGWIPSLFRI